MKRVVEKIFETPPPPTNVDLNHQAPPEMADDEDANSTMQLH